MAVRGEEFFLLGENFFFVGGIGGSCESCVER